MKVGLKKNRHRWRFFRNFAGSRCCYVNLPLLHRLGAGMAKVKVAGKENNVVHAEIRKCLNDYSTHFMTLGKLMPARRDSMNRQRLRRSHKPGPMLVTFDPDQTNQKIECKTQKLKPPVAGALSSLLELRHD